MSSRKRRVTLGAVFDRHKNGLSSIRLIFACSVIAWHSFPLTGHSVHPEGVRDIVSSFRADGFFAISGFLILATWLRHPNVRAYVRARVLRILPAFWVSLIVTAFLIAPLAMVIADGSAAQLMRGEHSSWMYVIANATTRMSFYDIAGTPTQVPWPGAWDGAVWTLQWEMLAYAGLLALGLLGLARQPRVLLGLAFCAWLAVLVVALDLIPRAPQDGLRCALMFLTGACFYAYRNCIPLSFRTAVGAALLLIVGCFLPDYRLSAAPALAYLVLYLGSVMKHPRWRRANDLSFGLFLYGFPVQQALLVVGWPWLNPVVFFAVSIALTLPFAALSWFAVERPFMRLKKRIDHRVAERGGERALAPAGQAPA